jgi:hypothetical protein
MYQDIFFKNSKFRKDDNDPSLEFVRSSLLGESEVSSLLIYSVGIERGEEIVVDTKREQESTTRALHALHILIWV